MNTKKILIFGLPGSGKTTLAKALSTKLNAVHWNADAVRANINKDLGFSEQDRLEQSRRMGWLCDQVVKTGHWAIADFVCPTEKTREAFGDDYIKIWVDTIKEGRFEDTNKIFEPPRLGMCDFRVYSQDAEFWSKYIYEDIDIQEKPSFIKMLFRSELV